MVKPQAGAILNGQVRLIEPIADGGMGSVWIAHHLALDTRVAVKFLLSELAAADPTLKRRLKREARITAELRSVHAVQTFDHGVTEEGLGYIVMELLEGIDLGRLVELSGALPLDKVATIVAQVAKVLSRAHKIGIVHRDIKPANIFLVDSEYDLFVKVLDFGIAKSAKSRGDSVVTREGALMGTVEFMSPEQATAPSEIDFRSDLFSLGVLVYYGLTARLPFEMSDDAPLVTQWQKGPPRVSALLPELPVGIDSWFARALAMRREDRFAGVAEMSAELAAIAGLPAGGLRSIPAGTAPPTDTAPPFDTGPPLDDDDDDERATNQWVVPERLSGAPTDPPSAGDRSAQQYPTRPSRRS